MLSYDAMIRMEIDLSQLRPATTLCVIELSTGNVMKQQKFGWPLGESDLPRMVSLCREALRDVKKPAAAKLRVRTLWHADAIVNERIRPLGRRLIGVFDEALQRSDRVVLVQHLEAATAKEESFLLLLGLSRLPGQRQFTPQADATIELRISEGDGQGKKFSETPLEIGVRLRRGAAYEGQWMTTVGLVRDFDAMIPQAWQKLSRSLGEVRGETVATMLKEMSLRRRQAKGELQLVNDLRAVAANERGAGDSRERHLKALFEALPHAEAAMKLDPTFPEAGAALVQTLADISGYDYCAPRRMPDAAIRVLREAAQFLAGFRQDSQRCGQVCTYAFYALCRSPLRQLLVPQARHELSWLSIAEEEPLVLTPDRVQDLEAVKRVLERSLDDDVEVYVPAATYMAVLTYRGMKRLDVPPAERQAWLEKISHRCAEKYATAQKARSPFSTTWDNYCQMQLRIAGLFIEERQIEQAKQIIAWEQRESPATGWQSPATVRLMRDVISKTHDTQLRADSEQRRNRANSQPPRILQVKWPRVDVFSDPERRLPSRVAKGWSEGPDRPPLRYMSICPRPKAGSRYRWNYSLLAVGDGRLYFVGSQPQFTEAYPYDVIAYIPVDSQGRPESGQTALEDNCRSMPQPKLGKSPAVICGKCVSGRLCLGTCSSGLQVFDPKAENWNSYGPEQGLPSSMVRAIESIGGQLLYCNSGDSQYTLNLADGTVRLIRRITPTDPPVFTPPLLMWCEGDRLMALDHRGLGVDLLSANPRYNLIDAATYDGWKCVSPYWGFRCAAEAGGRRFCVTVDGLHELDATGRIIRSWWSLFPVTLTEPPRWSFMAPPTCPLSFPSGTLYAWGSKLVFKSNSSLVAYDWKADTWYGPLYSPSSAGMLVTPEGAIWGVTPNRDGLAYLSWDNFASQAKAAGRVVTTTEFQRRRQTFIDAAEPLDRGKLALGMAQFDRAKAAFGRVLDAKPRDPEGLLLMGLLHDRDCLNRPDDAIEYYRRLAESRDDPSAAFTGMYLWTCVLRDQGQWKETLQSCDKILQLYPGLEDVNRQRIQILRDYSHERLNQVKRKPPGECLNARSS